MSMQIYDVMSIWWACVLRIRFMRMLIYVILRGLRLVKEWNAIINLENDMVKNFKT